MRPTTLAFAIALASSNVLAGCGGCYDPEVPAIPAGVLGTVVSFDDAEYDAHGEVFTLAGAVGEAPLMVSWSLD
jgi:hypothetical protein